MEATVLTDTAEINHVDGAYRGGRRETAGEAKQVLIEKAKAALPRTLMNEDRQRADSTLVDVGNMHTAGSDAVYKNARYAALKSNDRDRDPLISLLNHGKELAEKSPFDNFISFVGLHPASAIFMSRRQATAVIRLAKSPLREKEPLILSMDSTCKIGGKFLSEDYKRQVNSHFYRAVVAVRTLNRGEKEILPVIEGMVLNEDTPTVKWFLGHFLKKLAQEANMQHTSLPASIFDIAIVDKALSSLYALSETFNGIPLFFTYNLQYKALVYSSLGRGKEAAALLKPLVMPALCYVHNMKNVSLKLRSLIDRNTSEYKFLKRCFRLLMSSVDLQHLLFVVWRSLCTVLLSRFTGESLQSAVKTLKSLMTATKNFESKNGYLPKFSSKDLPPLPTIDTEKLNTMSDDLFYRKTAFYHAFDSVREVVEAEVAVETQDTSPNFMYCPELIRFILIYHAPHIAASSQVTHFIKFDKRYGIKPIRRNNQVSEEGFGELKKALRSDINCKIGGRIDRNIIHLRSSVEGTLKFVDFGDNYIGSLESKDTPVRSRKPLIRPRESGPLKRKRAEEVAELRAPKKKRKTLFELDEAKVKLSHFPTIESQWGRPDRFHSGTIRIAFDTKSTTSPLSRSTDREVTVNCKGLITEPTYYRRKLACVDRYQPLTLSGAPFSGIDIYDLCNPKAQIWSDTVTLTIRLLAVQHEQVVVLPSYVSADIFHARDDDLRSKMERSASYRIGGNNLPLQLFMPTTFSEHHYLCYADFGKRLFLCADSSRQGTAERQNLATKFKHFINYLRLNQVSVGGWTARIVPHLLQNDNVSCGAFVIKHAEQILVTGSTQLEAFEPSAYRHQIFARIVEAADDMRDACLVCLGTKNGTIFTGCSMCRRFIHKCCLKPEYSPQMQGVCELCYLFITK